jgi:glutathione synthase/RimK-type ligase-like ATP-grasp enzyme
MINFFRRRKLGKGSTHGMMRYLASNNIETNTILHGFRYPREYTVQGDQVSFRRFHEPITYDEPTMFIRWGCTASMGGVVEGDNITVLNKTHSISKVNDKRGFRVNMLASGNAEHVPTTWLTRASYGDAGEPVAILRPRFHAQGRNLLRVDSAETLQTMIEQPAFADGWYLSEFIDKQKEYRVYFVNGRVASVAEKIPHDRNQLAWNVAQGGEFRVVRWDDYHMPSIRAAYAAHQVSGLDFSGVDVMVDADGKAYVLEVNSAPSLPFNSDNSVSYRQASLAKCFSWEYTNYRLAQTMLSYSINSYDNWRNVIHPALNHNAIIS